MNVKCPICGQEGIFGWLGEADQEGIIAMVKHVFGMKPSTDWRGKPIFVEDAKRCFLKQSDIENEQWFKDWLIEKKRLDEEERLKKDKEWDDWYRDNYK